MYSGGILQCTSTWMDIRIGGVMYHVPEAADSKSSPRELHGFLVSPLTGTIYCL